MKIQTCVCVCACMHVYMWCVLMDRYVSVCLSMWVCLNVYVHVCACTCACTHTLVFVILMLCGQSSSDTALVSYTLSERLSILLKQGRSHDFLGGQVYFAPSRSYLYFTLRKELLKCSSSYKMHNLFQYCTNNTCKQSMSQLGGLQGFI